MQYIPRDTVFDPTCACTGWSVFWPGCWLDVRHLRGARGRLAHPHHRQQLCQLLQEWEEEGADPREEVQEETTFYSPWSSSSSSSELLWRRRGRKGTSPPLGKTLGWTSQNWIKVNFVVVDADHDFESPLRRRKKANIAKAFFRCASISWFQVVS